MSSKTPVSALQEMSVQMKIGPPLYDLISSRPEGVNPEFRYSVKFQEVTAVGTGRSKKEAKHNAAENALKTLLNKSDDKIVEHKRPVNEKFESPYCNQVARNYVGDLSTLCANKNLPEPIYSEVSAEGPSHAPSFTLSCKVSQIIEYAQATTKKQAKHLVAKKVYQRISDINLESIKTEEIQKKCVGYEYEEEEAVLEKVKEKCNTPRPPRCINDLHLALAQTPQDVLLHLIDDKNSIGWSASKRVGEIANELKVRFEKKVNRLQLRDSSFLNYAIVSVMTTPPVITMGKGSTENEAIENASEQVLRHLLILLADKK